MVMVTSPCGSRATELLPAERGVFDLLHVGNDIPRKLAAALQMLKDRSYRSRVVEALAITDAPTLTTGLKRLSAFAQRVAPKPT